MTFFTHILARQVSVPAVALSQHVDALRFAKEVLPFPGDKGTPSSFLFLVVRPGAPSSLLAPSSDARSP